MKRKSYAWCSHRHISMSTLPYCSQRRFERISSQVAMEKSSESKVEAKSPVTLCVCNQSRPVDAMTRQATASVPTSVPFFFALVALVALAT
eukprot:g79802.t1